MKLPLVKKEAESLATHTLNPGQGSWAISSPLHNKLAVEDRPPFHGWYRFVLSYPPHLVRKYLVDFDLPKDAIVLDPFSGTGTTLVEAKKLGYAVIGIEPHPMAYLASKVKCNWQIDAKSLAYHARVIFDRLQLDSNSLEGEFPARALFEQFSLFGIRTLESDGLDLLLQGSISPLQLHKCLRIKDEIKIAPTEFSDLMKVALAWTVVNTAGNIRFGPEVGITLPRTTLLYTKIGLHK